MKPFRFGVNVGRAGSRAEWKAKARKVEGLGYATLTLPDHLTDLIAPMPALISAAEATTTLRVGTNVLNNDLRHPVLVAREAAAVDLLTDGRLQLGLSAGSIQSEYDQAGLSFNRGATRVERLAEAVTIIKGLLRGEQVAFAGRHYRVTGHKIAPLPVQRPHPEQFEFHWTVADYIAAILAAGCRLVHAEEFGDTSEKWEGAPLAGLPGSLLLVGRRNG